MKVNKFWLFFVLVLGALIAVGCKPRPAVAEQAVVSGTQPVEVTPPTGSGAAITETVVFSLQSSVVDGRLVYVGVGGDIDGVVNPDLVVQHGVTVHVTLINGDGIAHDVSFPDFNAKSALVISKDDTADVSFEVKADQIGTYSYFCTQPGHRQAGQEGQLIVIRPE